MSNYRRYYHKGGYYFFSVVTYNRRKFLTDPLPRKILREIWLKVKSERPFKTIALCLLPDHLHCIWKLPENDCDYSIRWASIKARFTKAYLKQKQSVGWGSTPRGKNPSRKRTGEAKVWQRRFWEHLIRDENDLHKHIDYIHYNPIKHQLTETAEAWPYSTYKKFINTNPLSKEPPSLNDVFVPE